MYYLVIMCVSEGHVKILMQYIFIRVKVYTKSDGKVCIHPKSVNVEETEFHYSWLVYHLKMKTSSVSIFSFFRLVFKG